jgi:hypothetical protein
MTDPPQQRMTELRNALVRLHKTLLDSERAVYDRDVQRITSPGQFLRLAMHDPWFEWLRELSQLIVAIDEALDAEEPATLSDAERFLEETRALLSPSESGAGFVHRYYEALQRDPDVVIAHGRTMKLLNSL